MNAIASTPHYESIRLLRGLAALAVAVSHLPAFVPGLPAGLAAGKAGVDVFFVISGFVMAVSTAADPAGAASAGRFLWRRCARIVPLYWAVTLLLAALFASGLGFGAERPLSADLLWRSLLFVPVHGAEGDIRPLIGVGWTLDYEMYFYLVFAAVLAVAPRGRLAVVAGMLLVLHLAGRALLPASPDWIVNAGLVPEFALGMLLAALRHRPAALLATAITALAVAAASHAELAGLHPLGAGWARSLSWGALACAIVAGALWAEAASASPAGAGPAGGRPVNASRTAWRHARAWRPLGALGDASYSLYLTHSLAFAVLRRVLSAAGLGGQPVLACLILLAGAVGAALLTYRWFERPITRRLQAPLARA